jgi:hypothetical protein
MALVLDARRQTGELIFLTILLEHALPGLNDLARSAALVAVLFLHEKARCFFRDERGRFLDAETF